MDTSDRRIISHLLEDGRASYAVIGAAVGLSAPAVKRRVDRLVEEGVIRGFTAVIDPQAVGWSVEAYVELHCKGTVAPEVLREGLVAVPEVHAAATVSGTADAILQIVASDVRHLERALEQVRAELPNVDRTQTAIVLSRLVDRYRPTEVGPVVAD